MRPKSITNNSNFAVVFQDSGFEAGIRLYRREIWPYCAWTEDAKPKIIGENVMISSWDELLLKLAAEKPEAVMWLLLKRISLIDPKGTLISLAKSKAIEVFYNSVEEMTVCEMLELHGGSGSKQLAEMLEYYGWEKASELHSYFYCYVGDTPS